MSKRYRLAFLETICHRKDSHSYSSHRQTNGGTSLKRKQSSLKGFERRGNKFLNKIEEEQKQKDNNKAFIYQKCHHYGVDGNLAKGDLCEANNDCIPLDGIARVRSYKGGFNHREILQAERKHASKCANCAKANHEGGYVQLQCSNVADIPPHCLVDDLCSKCIGNIPCAKNIHFNMEKSNNEKKSNEHFETVWNGLSVGQLNENSDKIQSDASQNRPCIDNSFNGHTSFNHNTCMNTDAIGDFV